MPYFMEMVTLVALAGLLLMAYWARRDASSSAAAWGEMLEKQRKDALEHEQAYWDEAKRLIAQQAMETEKMREALTRRQMFEARQPMYAPQPAEPRQESVSTPRANSTVARRDKGLAGVGG